MTFDPDGLRAELGTGLLCFPVTHAREDFGFDEDGYREHIAWLSSFPAAGLFAAAGAGEFPALTPPEVGDVVRAAVAESSLPVIAPAGYGTADAVGMVRDAEEAGAAGVFLLAPYLAALSDEARVGHVREVCKATDLGVIVPAHPGAGVVWGLAQECPNLIGFSDAAGVAACSSAIFNFAPRFALDFHTALRAKDAAAVRRKLDDFVAPYLELRARQAGYGVAIVKAALTAVGRPAGPVRPPLTDLTATEFGELKALVEKVNLD